MVVDKLVRFAAGPAVSEGRVELMAEGAPGAAAPERLVKMACEIVAINVVRFRGKVISSTGDRIVAEFKDPKRAVRAALGMQEYLARLNDGSSASARCPYRIGVGFHDAAALCTRADVTGICVDSGVRDAVIRRLDVSIRELPVTDAGAGAPAYTVASDLTGRVFRYKRWTTPLRRRVSLIVAGVLIAVIVVLLGL